jgi:GAF domain-containing protein/HAMP domain-containing protein
VAGVAEEATVLNARIYDGEGRITADAIDDTLVFQHLVDPFAQRVLASPEPLYEWQPDRLVAGQSITVGRQMVGAVSVEISTAPLDATVVALRNQGITVGALAALAVMLLAAVYSRVITGPLEQLVTATRRFASGDLNERVPLRIGDEYALVGASFNAMAGQLQETIGSLERQQKELEHRVQDLDFLNRISEAMHRTGRDLDSLLTLIKDQVTQLLQVDSFYVALYDADNALLSYPLAVKHHERQSWPNRPLENRLTDQVVRTGQPRLISRNAAEELARSGMPVSEETPAAWLGVPMTTHDQTIGCIAVFSTAPEIEFTADDLNLLSILAGYLTVAIENSRSFQAQALSAEENRRLYEEAHKAGEAQRQLAKENQALFESAQKANEELNTLTRRLTGQAWDAYLAQGTSEIVVEDTEPGLESSAASSQPEPAGDHTVTLPIVLRSEVLGSVVLERADGDSPWTEHEMTLLKNVVERAATALDNARLLEGTQQTARREQMLSAISLKMQTATAVKSILQTAADEMRRATGSTRAVVRLGHNDEGAV